jgi:CRISPR/Cas system type I-B associated protein Csh2 (Cas7 group RAMP superfamily)
MGAFMSKSTKSTKSSKSSKSKSNKSIKESDLKEVRVIACKGVINVCKHDKSDECKADIKRCKEIIKKNKK